MKGLKLKYLQFIGCVQLLMCLVNYLSCILYETNYREKGEFILLPQNLIWHL